MKKIADRIFGSPQYLRELLFAARFGALLQFVVALFFLFLSRNGGPLGCLAVARTLNEAALVTLTLEICVRIFVGFLRKGGLKL